MNTIINNAIVGILKLSNQVGKDTLFMSATNLMIISDIELSNTMISGKTFNTDLTNFILNSNVMHSEILP